MIPGSGRSPGEGNGNPVQYSCLENSMDRGAWRAIVHRVMRIWTRLRDLTLSHYPLLIFSMGLFISYLFAGILTSWTWILVVLYTSFIVLADVIIFIARLGRCRCSDHPGFRMDSVATRQSREKMVGDGKRVCPQPPLLVKAVTGVLRKTQVAWRQNDCLPLPTMPFRTSPKLAFLQKRGNLLSIGCCVEQMSKFM